MQKLLLNNITCLKTGLWSIVKCNQPAHPEYYVDDIAKQFGPEVDASLGSRGPMSKYMTLIYGRIQE